MAIVQAAQPSASSLVPLNASGRVWHQNAFFPSTDRNSAGEPGDVAVRASRDLRIVLSSTKTHANCRLLCFTALNRAPSAELSLSSPETRQRCHRLCQSLPDRLDIARTLLKGRIFVKRWLESGQPVLPPPELYRSTVPGNQKASENARKVLTVRCFG